MRGNTKTATRPELMLRNELRRLRIPYRTNVQALVGVPDIVLPKSRVVIFCDGDFWHGRHWRRRKTLLSRGFNGAYWVAKVESNRKRARIVTRQLRAEGWVVLRFWESEIRSDVRRTAQAILRAFKCAKIDVPALTAARQCFGLSGRCRSLRMNRPHPGGQKGRESAHATIIDAIADHGPTSPLCVCQRPK
jgi:DNA mismatch endonuclease (patch repair protein)